MSEHNVADGSLFIKAGITMLAGAAAIGMSGSAAAAGALLPFFPVIAAFAGVATVAIVFVTVGAFIRDRKPKSPRDRFRVAGSDRALHTIRSRNKR